MTQPENPQPWASDLLDFARTGDTFTHLIQSLTEAKVISIEAAFGHGKTFFRKNWARQLRAAGEVVVEFDAQMADRTGDPVISLLGAMVASVPQTDAPKTKAVREKAMALGGIAARAVTRIVVRNGADEIFAAVAEGLADKLPDSAALEKTLDDVGAGLSKYASNLIANQLATEKAIQELPDQLDALRKALAPEKGRVVVLIDELDRCHPEYAIALLEAMKLVFKRDGFVFCLMVNPEYLENIAQHRFGMKVTGEAYLDKFIDLRLALRAGADGIKNGAKILAQNLPLKTPFGTDHEFSVERAAEVAGELAAQSGLSFRQIKRALENVELALRCYGDEPLDCALLVYLALRDAVRRREGKAFDFPSEYLPRAQLTREKAAALLNEREINPSFESNQRERKACEDFVRDACSALINLERDRYSELKPHPDGKTYYNWYLVLAGLGPIYIPRHEKILAMVHELQAQSAADTATLAN